MRILLLAGALVVGACASRNAPLPELVGESTAGAAPRPQMTARDASVTSDPTANDAERRVTGEDQDPCGAIASVLPFRASATDIAEPQLEELRRLARCLATGPYATASVVLVGYTDVLGTVPGNLELGLARAQAVMRQLMSDGVSPGRIVVASAGELQRPHASLGLDADRVEILLARGGPARPDEAPIARGIEAEGLLPRRKATQAAPAAPSAPAVRKTSSSGVSPRAR